MTGPEFFKMITSPFCDEISAAEAEKAKQSLTWEHGLHAFLFLSFILAEALKIIIETFTNFLPSPDWRPEAILLCAMTLLTIQYWWVVYESASFYGKYLVPNFLLGVLEVAMFYATAFLLSAFYPVSDRRVDYDSQLRLSFMSFGVLVLLFIVVDGFKSKKWPHKWPRELWIRQLVRMVGVILCGLGSCKLAPKLNASILLILVIIYTAMQAGGRWVDSRRVNASVG